MIAHLYIAAMVCDWHSSVLRALLGRADVGTVKAINKHQTRIVSLILNNEADGWKLFSNTISLHSTGRVALIFAIMVVGVLWKLQDVGLF